MKRMLGRSAASDVTATNKESKSEGKRIGGKGRFVDRLVSCNPEMLDRPPIIVSINVNKFMRRLVLLLYLCLALAPTLVQADGSDLYRIQCSACHGPEGKGIPGVFPPLAGADFLRTHREQALRAPMEGLQGPLTVNGQTYHGQMPSVALRDPQMVKLFNFIFSAWG
jgi:mono/diheme cytochrome c family protein